MSNGFSAYLLAAGRGKRAGGPKAWLKVGGTPLLEKQVSFLSGRYGSKNIAVTVQEGWLPRCRAIDSQVHWVAEDPEGTPMHALRALLDEVPFPAWVFYYHVDMPVWIPGLFDALEEAAEEAQEGVDAVVASSAGKGGHPVLLSQSACEALKTLDPEIDRLDMWLRTRRVVYANTEHAEIFENWNEGRVIAQ